MAPNKKLPNLNYKIPRIIDGTLSSFLAHVCFIPQHLRTHRPWKWGFEAVEKFSGQTIDFTEPNSIDYTLAHHLRYYKPNYREKIQVQKRYNRHIWLLDGANIRLIKKKISREWSYWTIGRFFCQCKSRMENT